jgi:dGTP triphosphohydrolase
VVVFHSLTKEHIRHIVDLMLSTITQQLAEKGIKLEVTDAAKDFLGEKGYDEVFGARPLRRVIQNMVENKLSEAVLRQEFKVFDRVFVIEAEIAEITPAIVDAIKEIKGVLSVDITDSILTVYCTQELKLQTESVIKDNDVVLVKIKQQSYISKVVVDVADGEIVLKSEEKLLPHPPKVSALLREDKI